MQCFGSMDILCVDKTGTLTSNNIILEYYLDILGNENQKTLDFAYLNSYHLSIFVALPINTNKQFLLIHIIDY